MLCAISLTFAQTNQTKIALVIGNANYQHGGKLKNPVNDANLMATTLQNKGFTVIKKTDATLAQMQMATVNFTKKIKDYDVALFYYAGHGVQVDGNNYLVPVDANLDDKEMVSYLALNINDVNDAFNQNTDNINIMILDACRNDPFASWERGGERGFKKIDNSATGTIIAFATQPGATAADGDYGNGLYTSKLVEQIKKPQSIEAVFKKTRIEVNKASGGKQIPQEWSSLMGDFYFTAKGKQVVDPNESTWGDEEVVYTYGNIEIYTEFAGDFYLDGTYKGKLTANTRKTLKTVTTGNYSYKIKGNNETKTGNITVYKNQTAKIEAKSTYVKPKDLPNVITDSRDGKTYKIVEIGNQVWMAENLAYKANSGCWAYDNDQSNVAKYGYLYNFETAQNVCPNGYHLPTIGEYETLLNNYGGDSDIEANYTALISSGSSGFSAFLGGYRGNTGSFGYNGYGGYFWSASALDDGYAWRLDIDSNYEESSLYGFNKSSCSSVRCVQDN